jgi:hypothetical protein
MTEGCGYYSTHDAEIDGEAADFGSKTRGDDAQANGELDILLRFAFGQIA